jgi:hypothetical protein
MLKVFHRFGKRCSFHPQGDCAMSGSFWKTYTGQAGSRYQVGFEGDD